MHCVRQENVEVSQSASILWSLLLVTILVTCAHRLLKPQIVNIPAVFTGPGQDCVFDSCWRRDLFSASPFPPYVVLFPLFDGFNSYTRSNFKILLTVAQRNWRERWNTRHSQWFGWNHCIIKNSISFHMQFMPNSSNIVFYYVSEPTTVLKARPLLWMYYLSHFILLDPHGLVQF